MTTSLIPFLYRESQITLLILFLLRLLCVTDLVDFILYLAKFCVTFLHVADFVFIQVYISQQIYLSC